MIDILNLTFPELERFIVEDLGQPKFRAAQVWQWIWQKHATSFDAMTDVSKQLRAKLAEVAEIVLPEIVTVQTSSDGTEKLLLRLRDGALVETVILPSTGQDGSVRIAQCVSSQIGCAMGCTFCSTGTMGFIRNTWARARAMENCCFKLADVARVLPRSDGADLPSTEKLAAGRRFRRRTSRAVSKQLRAKLAEVAEIVLPEIVTVQTSCDGTEKLLLRLRDGALVETVILPSTGQDGSVRIAQCVSSQIGCAMGCTFCSTGTMGFIRNMTAGEILSQVLVARMRLGDNRIDHPIIRNLVFMGMGEPLLNLRETTRALEMLNHDKGMDFSPRRITVSTCGIKAGLRELGDSGLAFLAVSLHAPNQELRAKIMPKAANWHLDDLMATLESYPLKTREHITFEYLLLGGVNDQPEHARELAKLVSRVKGKLNLIAYNPSETQLYKGGGFDFCMTQRREGGVRRNRK